METIIKIEEKAEKILDHIGCVIFFLMIISTFFNIFSYWFIGKRFAQFDEITLAIFVWVVFIVTGPLYKRDEHIGVTFIVDKMQPKARSIFRTLADVIVFVTSVLVMIYTWKLMMRSFNKHTFVLGIPYVYIDAGVFFGYISLTIVSIFKLFIHISEIKQAFKKEVEVL